jgi:hypothetical protein
MSGRIVKGPEPVSLCCASGVLTEDLEGRDVRYMDTLRQRQQLFHRT